jgi:hypothetical protein
LALVSAGQIYYPRAVGEVMEAEHRPEIQGAGVADPISRLRHSTQHDNADLDEGTLDVLEVSRMTVIQFACGLFHHKPAFHEMHKSGAWMYRCQRCGYENTGYWFYRRNEINKDKPL